MKKVEERKNVQKKTVPDRAFMYIEKRNISETENAHNAYVRHNDID